MSWIGAGIGAGIGMMIGGPIGAGIGAWLGHSMGKARTAMQQGVAGPQMGRKEAQTVFFVALFSMLAKMARADGRVTAEEADIVNRFARQQLKLDAEDRKAAREIFSHALNDGYSIYDYADQYREIVPGQQMREMIYRLLFTLAYADGKLHPGEDAILKEIPPHLGLDGSYYAILREEFQGRHADIRECYEILGCAPESTDAEVKRAYRKRCMEYHPDRIASKGLPEGFMKFAEEQMHRINESYNTIMASRKHG